ncbi:MAG: hypothetical protein H6961_11755 [Chromatiaceae bacterium]|nr:hypothetical protein [Chromatiaceae bacterium]
MITLKNDFHNTEVRLQADIGDELTPAQIRRAKQALCGIDGCTCSGDAGERGQQEGFELVPARQDTLRIVSTERGRGNPGVVHGETQKRRNITLSDRLAEKARKIGSGNISEGIRKALDEYT